MYGILGKEANLFEDSERAARIRLKLILEKQTVKDMKTGPSVGCVKPVNFMLISRVGSSVTIATTTGATSLS